MAGKQDLDNSADAASGAAVTNAQKEINGIGNFVGRASGGAHDSDPTWTSDAIGVANEDVKSRVDAVQTQVETNDADIDTKMTKITSTDNAVPKFNTTNGEVQDTGIIVDDFNNVTGVNDLTVTGDLTVNGTTTTVNTTNMEVTDPNIILNNGGTFATADDIAGITVEMSDSTDGSILFDGSGATTSKWKVGLVGSEVEVATISGAQTITNKDIDGGTMTDDNRITLPKETTTNLNVLSDKAGTIAYDTTLSKPVYNDGSVWTEMGGGGTGEGGINYITNAHFETDASDWNTYADAAAATPVDGTGGTPHVNITLGTTLAELRGQKSLYFAMSTATNIQGNGFSTDIAIDSRDQYAKLNLTFDYKFFTASAGDWQVFIYDVDNTTLLGNLLNDQDGVIPDHTGTGVTYQGSFYATDSLNYRVIFHITSTAAQIRDFAIDRVRVSPDESVPGAIVTDPVDFTPTWTNFTLGNGTVHQANYHREGRYMVGNVRVALGSTSSVSGAIQIDVPDSKNVDTSVIEANDTVDVGAGVILDSGTSFYVPKLVLNGSTKILMKYLNAAAIPAAISATTPMTWTTNDTFSFHFKIPILEWTSASNLVSTTQTLFSTAKTKIYLGSNQSITDVNDNTVEFDTESFAEGGGSSTLGSYRIDINKSAYYIINANLRFSSYTQDDGTRISLLNSSGAFSYSYYSGSAASIVSNPITTVKYLEKGDYVYVNAKSTADSSYTIAGDENQSYLEVIELPDFSVFGVHGETELLEDSSAGYVAFPTAANQWVDLGSEILAPGEYDFFLNIGLNSSGATTTGDVFAGLGTVSGNTSPGTVGTDYVGQVKDTASGSENSIGFVKKGITVASTTTYYIKAYAVTSISNLQVAHHGYFRRVK